MYRIDYVPDIPMTDVEGEPIFKIIGVSRSTGEPVYDRDGDGNKIQRVASQLKFMLGAISGPKFVDKLDAIDGSLLVDDTRTELRTQLPIAKERGYWELEDDVAKRLQAAAAEPRTKEQIEAKLLAYDLSHIHNFAPSLRALQKMKKIERTAIEKPEEKSAEQPS